MKFWTPEHPATGLPLIPTGFYEFLVQEQFEYTEYIEDSEIIILAGFGCLPTAFYTSGNSQPNSDTFCNKDVWTTLYAALFVSEWYSLPVLGFGVGAALLNAKCGKAITPNPEKRNVSYPITILGEGKQYVSQNTHVGMSLEATPNIQHRKLQSKFCDTQECFPVAVRNAGSENGNFRPVTYEAVVYKEYHSKSTKQHVNLYGLMRAVPILSDLNESTQIMFYKLIQKINEEGN